VDEPKRERHEERRTCITKEEQEVEAEEAKERTEPSLVVRQGLQLFQALDLVLIRQIFCKFVICNFSWCKQSRFERQLFVGSNRQHQQPSPPLDAQQKQCRAAKWLKRDNRKMVFWIWEALEEGWWPP
jgi:hypothetical protein